MKNQTYHPVFYFLLQMLGIWIDGILGIGFEIMAVLIFSFGKKRSLENLFNQSVVVIAVEILIDLFCGNAEMIFETGFWFLEEMRRAVLAWSWVFSPILIFYFFQKRNALWLDKFFINQSETKIPILQFNFHQSTCYKPVNRFSNKATSSFFI